METKVFLLENLCCANCAAKIEDKINTLPGVQAALTFATRQLRVTAEDPAALLPELERIARRIEPDVIITLRKDNGHHQKHSEHCECGHEHHHEHGEHCGCGHEHHHEHGEHCGCGHEHHHEHSEHCSCGHEHHHEHGELCGCGHAHRHEHSEHCGCGHEHHHEHGELCGCGHEHHHEHGELCGCGHEHHHEHGEHCGCGHTHDHGRTCKCGQHHEEALSHDHGHDHSHGAQESVVPLLIGAALFAAGLVFEGWISLAACAAAFVLLGWNVVRKAVEGLFQGHMLDENFLMSVASIGAFFIGNAPEGVGVMLFYRVGEWFEHMAVERSRSQIMEAVDLRPETVNRLEQGEIRVIPAGEAQVGDLLLVRPGDRIPLDGIVVSGNSRIDTAPITGEPVPVAVGPGSSVTSGCVNTAGQLTIRAEKVLEESMVTRILNSVENAAAGKPKIDRFITRFARIYTPVVVAIAAATAIVPSLITGNWSYWVYTALSFLVMSCPCALVLSVPLAFFAGIGAGSKRGILFKGGISMEALGKIRAVVMDKTGTLTQGDFRVQEVTDDVLLALCAACEEQSTHPIAVSITQAARERNLSWELPETLEELAGRGIRAIHRGRTVLVGNETLLADHGIAVDAEGGCGTRIYVAVDGVYAGSLLISDTVKADSAQAVSALNTRGYTTAILTGDAEDSAQAVARELGIQRCHASLLPHQKLEELQRIRSEVGPVLFVGDGINDAPVLAGADVGAAMGSGADAAIEAADVVFMTSQAAAIPQALEIAGKTQRIAWQNAVFALAIKFLVMALGLLGYASMWLAVFADSGVAMLCVLNSIRMLYKSK